MDKSNSYYAIIVAGGSGARMGSVVPKQFLLLQGKPVLMRSIEAFYQNEYQPNIILVLAATDIDYWNELVKKYQFKIPHQIEIGGSERFNSVKNGLNLIKDANAVVAIHDAVRPLVSQLTISNCFLKAKENGNAVAAVIAKDSIRQLSLNTASKALNRSEIYLVQTPQTFIKHQLDVAYQQNFDNSFTDDASVVEKAGFDIYLEKGDEFNFKITFKEDLLLAEALIRKVGS